MSHAVHRRSPFTDAWSAAQPACVTLANMPVPEAFATHDAAVMLADLSFLSRTGFKGSAAASWLQAQSLVVPTLPNHWVAHRRGLVARLGMSEFFLESATADDWVSGLSAPADLPVVPVLRQDAALLLCGERVHELLLQVCSYNFASLTAGHSTPAEQAVVMTQMLGISVLMLAIPHAALPVYRLWCDPSFATYLWRQLALIAAELEGGPVGWQQLQLAGIPCAFSAAHELISSDGPL